MADRPTHDVLTLSDLRGRVAWLFYGTRSYSGLASDSQAAINDIISDGYERFLNPPVLPGKKAGHRWGFLRPFITIPTEADKEDYALPSDFGGLDGPIFYRRADSKRWPMTKTDPSRIQYLRQRDYLTVTSQPTEFAIVGSTPTGMADPTSILMLWPTPDAAYNLDIRYYILTRGLTDAAPFPASDAFHNQTLLESCLAVAEERLEDQKSIHGENFMERLQASVAYDIEKYAGNFQARDKDTSDWQVDDWNDRLAGDYVSYSGYTHGWA